MSKSLLSSDEYIAPFTALTDTRSVLAFHSQCFPTPSLGALTFFFFLISFYDAVHLSLYIFLWRLLQRHHERVCATPAMTGAFSCWWNYVRHLKISKTTKFQGESSFLGSTAAMKEEGGWLELKLPQSLKLFPFPCMHKGGWLLRWKHCGWAGIFQRKIWFLPCQMPGFDKPGNILLVCLPLRKPSGYNLGDV